MFVCIESSGFSVICRTRTQEEYSSWLSGQFPPWRPGLTQVDKIAMEGMQVIGLQGLDQPVDSRGWEGHGSSSMQPKQRDVGVVCLICQMAELPRWLSANFLSASARDLVRSLSWEDSLSWGRKWQPTPVLLTRKSHGQRSLGGYSPWGHERVRHDLATKQQHRVKKSV